MKFKFSWIVNLVLILVLVCGYTPINCFNIDLKAQDVQKAKKKKANKKGGNSKQDSPVPMPSFVKAGFKVELIYKVPRAEQGSWVSMVFDDQGRMYACDQYGQGLYRMTPPAIGQKTPVKVEKMKAKVSAAQGLLWAFDSLYANVQGKGIFRVTDKDGDDNLEAAELIVPLVGKSEHGPHAVVLSPDGKSIYFIAGNATQPPKYDHSLPAEYWKEDQLLPRQPDARGHARTYRAPGGWIARCDPEGKNIELFAMGFRNPYDMAFNTEGELFAYDADMEWDTGSPWYRPTRVSHVTSGLESGWRMGTGKFPAYYADTLPATIDIGPGSPTGVVSGTGTRFPEKYQKALFINDWTFSTMYAVHLTPNGSSYTAIKEEIVAGKPLPLTDAAVNPRDGALYFAIGGRKGQSAVYRLVYTGSEKTDPAFSPNGQFKYDRELRRQLESFHTAKGRKDPTALETSWQYLNHDDRHIRFAARVAIEHQPVSNWRSKALAEKDPVKLIHACLALARAGEVSDGSKIAAALSHLRLDQLNEYMQLALLRTYGVTFARHGKPAENIRTIILRQTDALFPAASDRLNRELCSMLSYLQSPTLAAKVLPLMQQAAEAGEMYDKEVIKRNDRYGRSLIQQNGANPQLQQIHYAYALKSLKAGWNRSLRTKYFQWFNKAKTFKGGNSFVGFINNFRKEALGSIEDTTLRKQMEAINESLEIARILPRPKGPGRMWTVAEITGLQSKMGKGRDFEHGKKMYAAAMCSQCHVLAGEGGLGGPDLTQLGTRFTVKDMAEHILEPNKVISDEYHNLEFLKTDGGVVVGRLIDEKDGVLKIMPTPMNPEFLVNLAKKDVKKQSPSKVSPMMPGLLYSLNETELLDLFAYLRSAGNSEDQAFK